MGTSSKLAFCAVVNQLLQFGFGPERCQPNFAAWALRSQTGGFIKRASGPGIEDSREKHFVLDAGPVWSACWFECLQWIGHHSCTDNDVE